MPKLQLNFIKNPMVKELLMTFIGTTLSIVLTFGTAHYVDQKEKKALGRQTVMMVIHDMDNTVELLKEYSKDEKKGLELARYVIDRYDTMDSISQDTIWGVVRYFIENSSEVEDYIKEIKENLKQYQVKMRKKEKVQNKYGATINPSGNKIELALGVEDESGSKRQGVSYLQKSR